LGSTRRSLANSLPTVSTSSGTAARTWPTPSSTSSLTTRSWTPRPFASTKMTLSDIHTPKSFLLS
ncbi:unnamed protein product, partial [Aphanomyces euteiches]